jgi:glycosyltransferase involved in cell wall biosynthesis
MLSKAPLRGAYQRKLEELAALPEIEQLTVIVPPYWKEPRVGKVPLEKAYTRGYDLITETMALNGSYHLHFYPRLARWVKVLKPDLFHVDEESFNLATVQGIRLARRYGAKAVFYNWANIYKELPPPFRQFEQYSFKHASGALVGAVEAKEILERKGFCKPVEICPQFGVDPGVIHRTAPPKAFYRPDLFTIGYAGRLVEEKGLALLVEAAARLKGDCRVVFIGSGALQDSLQVQAERLKVRVEFIPNIPNVEMPAYLSGLDVLALPSLTRPNWKEQFGRILIEAMACGVPVMGSSSGEIPQVIGDAGLVFPEGDTETLTTILQKLLDNQDLRQELSQKGLRRVREKYTQAQIANLHLKLYQKALAYPD